MSKQRTPMIMFAEEVRDVRSPVQMFKEEEENVQVAHPETAAPDLPPLAVETDTGEAEAGVEASSEANKAAPPA